MNLTEAIKEGNRAQVEAALAAGESEVQGAPSPILLAMYYQEPEIAHLLRDRKGDLDVFEAAALGDLHQLEKILETDPKAADGFSSDGFTPLGYAAFFGHLEVVRLLLRKGASPNVASQNPLKVMPLHSALDGTRKEMARVLIDSGADVDESQGDGWTPLHYCANSGDVETAKYLIDKGARGDQEDSKGRLPADVAEEKGFTDLAEILRPKSG